MSFQYSVLGRDKADYLGRAVHHVPAPLPSHPQTRLLSAVSHLAAWALSSERWLGSERTQNYLPGTCHLPGLWQDSRSYMRKSVTRAVILLKDPHGDW